MKKISAGVFGLVGLALTTIGLTARELPTGSVTAIGGADGPTAIYLASSMATWYAPVLVAVGLVLVAAAIVVLVRSRKIPKA